MSYICNIQDNWEIHLPHPEIYVTDKKSKFKEPFYNLACGFDIETTTIIKEDYKHAYMYIWQFCIEELVVIGRTWNDFFSLIDRLEKHYSNKAKLLIWIHNMGFEMSFILPRINERITDSFYKDKHKPLYVDVDDRIRFQDSLAITGCSLEKTAEIYNLEHKKLTNDLDYTKLRNSKTELSAVELMYCYHDVLILRDFARKMFDEIIPNNFDKVPLTKTQLFLNKVYHNMEYTEKLHIHDILLSFNDYVEANNWLFRGGYVHANIRHTGVIMEDVQSIDFTSSYPAVMIHNKNYPIGKFRNIDVKLLTLDRFNYLCQNYACWITVAFKNIKQTTNHSIESKSKIKAIGDIASFDNGRLSNANYIEVELTELDFEIYKLYYQWTDMYILNMKIARRGSLPKGLIKTLMDDYIIKAQLKLEDKKDTIEYILAKQDINSAYGACCKKINFQNWTYNGGWDIENANESKTDVYAKWTKKQNILPFQFACWITSNARYNLLKSAFEFGDDCLYMDTDSIKCINYSKHKHIVDVYNNEMKELNKELIKIHPAFDGLGEFDENDGFYEKFKTLGAKRYVVIEDSKPHITVAGLPKKSLVNYIDKYKKDLMETFIDGLTLNSNESGKLTTCYNEETHSDYITDEQGNTELMTELSSCALYEIPFKMSLSKEYLSLITKTMNLNNNYIC